LTPNSFRGHKLQDHSAILGMNLTKPIQYSFLGLQGMTSKVHIVPKNREHPKSASLAQFPEENYSQSLWEMPRLAYFGKVFAHHFPY